MMIALAIKCEEIMNDPAYGDRTGQWFGGTITSLGLGCMYDNNFDKQEAINRINRFLDRDYAPNGKGGLFIARHSPRDMRTLEIWYQLQEFLNDIV